MKKVPALAASALLGLVVSLAPASAAPPARSAPPAEPAAEEPGGLRKFFGFFKSSEPGPAPEPPTTARSQAPEEPDSRKEGFFSRLWRGPAEDDKRAESAPEAPPSRPAADEAPRGSFFSRIFSREAPAEEAAAPAPAAPARPVKVLRTHTPRPVEGSLQLGPNRYVVTKDQTPFYEYGPRHNMPPDAYLRTGDLVTLLNRTWGWAEVRLEDGRTGIIGRQAVRLATVYDLPTPKPQPAVMAQNTKPLPAPAYVIPSTPPPELPALETEANPLGELPPLDTSLLPPFEN